MGEGRKNSDCGDGLLTFSFLVFGPTFVACESMEIVFCSLLFFASALWSLEIDPDMYGARDRYIVAD